MSIKRLHNNNEEKKKIQQQQTGAQQHTYAKTTTKRQMLKATTPPCNVLKCRLSNFKNGSRFCGRGSSYMRQRIATVLLLQLLLLLSAAPCIAAITNDENTATSSSSAAAAAPSSATQGHSLSHLKPNRSSIVQLFEWKFVDVAEECKSFLGPKGYAGVQLSPVTEHLVIKSDNVQHPWWERYHPISYTITTRSGNEEDFLAMSRICNDAGVRVYVDVVLNHMANSSTDTTSTGSAANVSALSYPAVPYVSVDFHKPCQLHDYTDAHEVRNCQLDGRPDLDHSRANVRQRIVELLNKLVDMGAAGFRVDAAKYMWPNDLKQIYDEVKNLNSNDFDFPAEARPFFYQEVVDLGTESISKTEYSSYGVVTEYLYAAELSTIFGGIIPLSALINWGPAMGFLPHHDAMVFIDTHDSQRGGLQRLGQNQLLTYKRRIKYIMANAFMLAHPYGGVKRIMSSYHFEADADDDDAAAKDLGPPTTSDNDDSIRAPQFDEATGQCTAASGWVCEHRWPAIANMVELANSLDEQLDGVINFQTYGPQHIAFCRGQNAFFAFNNDATLDYETQVFTCLEAGSYCDVITGGRKSDGSGCVGKRIVVDAEGQTNIMLPMLKDEIEQNVEDDVGVIAIYIGSKLADEAAIAGDATEVIEETAVAEVEPELEEPKEEVPQSADVKSEFEMVPEEIMAENDQVTEVAQGNDVEEEGEEKVAVSEEKKDADEVVDNAAEEVEENNDANRDGMTFSPLE